MQAMSQAPGIADDLARMRPGIEAHQDSLAGRPKLVDPMLGHVLLELRLGLLGCATQRHFAQGRQIPLAKEIVQRRLDAIRGIDIAVPHALPQGIRRDIDELYLVGLIQDLVRQRFAHTHARNACHQVVQAIQVLDIDRGYHMDARIEDLLDILIAFGMF